MVKFHRAHHARPTAKPSFVVAAVSGGIGRTTFTRIIEAMWADAGEPLRAVSIEATDDGRASKLSKLIDGAQQVGMEPARRDFRALGEGTDARGDPLDRVGDMLADGGHIFDLGANVVPLLIDWARRTRPRGLLEDAPILNVIVPTTATPRAAEDALWTLERFREVEPVFMRIRPAVVFNGLFGTLEECKHPEIAALNLFVEQERIPVAPIGCGPIGIAERFSYAELASANPREFAVKAGFSPMTANTHLNLFRGWLREATGAMRAAGLGPIPAEGRPEVETAGRLEDAAAG